MKRDGEEVKGLRRRSVTTGAESRRRSKKTQEPKGANIVPDGSLNGS